MIGKEMTYADIVNLYKNKFTQTSYPFRHPANPGIEFNMYEWVKIKIKSEKIHPNLLPFVIAINEIFRFELGSTQPECRLSDTHILSKKVEQDDEVGQFRVKTLYAYWNQLISNKDLYWEGIGRAVFCKYLYQDNDFNSYNALVDKNNYFIGLDTETCFWTVTEKYHYGPNHKPSNVKVLANNNSPFSVSTVSTAAGKPIYLIADKTRDFVGDLHKDDYKTLPKIKHFYPCNWFFLAPELKSFTNALANNPRFLNEKYFATLKSLVTTCMKQLLIDLHIQDAKDQQDANQLISSQLLKITEICKQSTEFMQYINVNRITAMQGVLYEINQFFNDISAYVLEDSAAQLRLQEYVYRDAIRQYETLLIKLNIPLISEEKFALAQYANAIHSHSIDAHKIAHDFYKAQGMNFHAMQANNRMALK
jgi:hypothetical protein